ncbi:MAG: InlB B-repeat-containing protein [Chitinispirillaceae bacterium]|nr:InlB B-repeat-containing protein [Chitinispirillaceae bacterium]
MKKKPLISFSLLFFYIATFLFCLPQNPSQDPNNADVYLLVDDVLLHQGDEPTIGVELFFPQHFHNVSVTTSCGVFNTSFSTDTLRMEDTVYLKPRFDITGPCTVFVNAQYKDRGLQDKCDTLPLFVLSRETGIYFTATPAPVKTSIGKTDTLLFITNASSGVVLPPEYKITAVPSKGITLTPLFSRQKDSLRVITAYSVADTFVLKVVVSALYGGVYAYDSVFTGIRVNAGETLIPSNVTIPNSIPVGTSDTLFFAVDNKNNTDKLTMKLITESPLDSAVFTIVTSGTDSLRIEVTPAQAGIVKIGIIVSNSKRSDTTWYQVTMGTVDALLWNRTEVAVPAIEGKQLKHDLRQYFIKPQTGDVVFSTDVGTINDTAWEWTPAYGYENTASAIISAVNNTTLSQIKMTITITPSDTVKPQLSLVDPTLDGKKIRTSQLTVNCIAKDSDAGIGNVSMTCGSITMAAVVQQDSIYSGVVTGLEYGKPTEITITAVDKSMKKNSRTLAFIVTYDTTVPGDAPSITIQLPATSKVIEGTTLSLKVVAAGTSPLTYKWYKNDELVAGQTGAEFSKNSVTATDSGSYYVIVNNTKGIVTSAKTVVSIRLKAVITSEPVATTVNEGGSGAFTITARGEEPLTYQWYRNGELITGATSAMYSITDAGVADNGKQYFCIAGNSINSDTSVTAILTVTAKPIYKVTFIVGEGVTATANQQIAEGGKVTQPAVPVRSGYDFGGWYKDSAATSVWNFTTDIVNGPVTLYAKWTQSLYTITFNKNDAATTGTMAEQTIASGSSAVLTKNSFVKTGWTFDGWAASSAGEVVYKDGVSYTMGAADVTLYAKWKQNTHTLTFNKNDPAASGTMSAQSIPEGTTVSLTPNSFTKAAWSFEGWATEADGAAIYADQDDFSMGTANVTLYAKWKAQDLTITFNKNDLNATGSMTPQTIASGSSAPLKANAFAKEGWTFDGWATSSSGAVSYSNQQGYKMGTTNVTLYAKWKANLYKITFDRNNTSAAGIMLSQNIACGSQENLTPIGFSESCMYFVGWATSPNGAAIYNDQSPYTMGVGNVTLYAIWAYPTMTVTPAYGQDLDIGGSGSCNPVITVSTSTCAASYEWHSVVFMDNILPATGPSITTENEWEVNNYYCVVTDLSGNRITSGTWHVAACNK